MATTHRANQTPTTDDLAELRLLDTTEVARLLGVTSRRLQRVRLRGEGPPFVRIGGEPRYPVGALREWIATTASTGAKP